jgi:hypothetical protein
MRTLEGRRALDVEDDRVGHAVRSSGRGLGLLAPREE